MAGKQKRAGGAPISTRAVEIGAPTGKWAEVLAKTRQSGKAIEPFDITADLVLYPPTPHRAKAMTTATMAAQTAVVAATNAVRHGASEDEVAEIRAAIEAADDAYTRALVGEDKYEAVEEFFADKGEWERQAFIDAVKQQFLRLPEDGVCQHCGQVIDADQAGNELESSTTSSTTGVSSRETSPSTSTEPEPETGASTEDLGTSSSTTATPLPV